MDGGGWIERDEALRDAAAWRALGERLRETGGALLRELDVLYDLDAPELTAVTDAFEEAILAFDQAVRGRAG